MATTQHDREHDLLEAHAKYRVLVEHLPAIVYTCEIGTEGNWLDDQFGVPSAMATALALVIVKGHDDRAFARGAAWLSGIGRGDGSWDAAPTLRIPPPWILDPTSFKAWRIDGLGSGVIVRDHHRTYTTATVIHALLS